MKILDTHLGSAVAGLPPKKQINFVGFEIDKEYFDKQEKRFADYVKQLTPFRRGCAGIAGNGLGIMRYGGF